jgi:hypothetical protein
MTKTKTKKKEEVIDFTKPEKITDGAVRKSSQHCNTVT